MNRELYGAMFKNKRSSVWFLSSTASWGVLHLDVGWGYTIFGEDVAKEPNAEFVKLAFLWFDNKAWLV